MADSTNNHKPGLDDLVLTEGADLSQLEQVLAEIPAAAETGARGITDAINTAALASAMSFKTPKVNLPDMRPAPLMTLRPEILDALSANQQKKLAQAVKVRSYELLSGNWYAIAFYRDGEIIERYRAAPTEADKLAAKECLRDALADLREELDPPVSAELIERRQNILKDLQRKLKLNGRIFLAQKLGTDYSVLRAITRCNFTRGGRDAEEKLFELIVQHGLEKEWGPRFPPSSSTNS